jgi:hypothetical protein
MGALLVGLLIAPSSRADLNILPIVFSRSSDTKPYFSEWRSGTWTPSAGTALSSVGATPTWVVLRNCPTRFEAACLTLDTADDINLLFYKETSWTSATELCTNTGTSANRAMSIAYESLSGDLLIAYWDTGLNQIGYRTYNGTTLSAQANLSLPAATHTEYVALYSKPNSDAIIMLTVQNDSKLTAVVWSGSGWGSAVTLSTSLSAKDQECVSLAYEGVSGRALVAYSSSSAGLCYRIWNGSAWTAETLAPPLANQAQWLRLAGNTLNNTILFGAEWYAPGGGGSGGIVVNTWNGTAWSSHFTVETSVPDSTMRRFDVGFEKRTSKGLVVYQEGTQTQPRYRTWNGTAWSTELNGPNIGDAARFIQIQSGGITGEMFIAASDAGNDLEVMRWDGATLSSSQQLCGALGGTSTTEPFMLAPPPRRVFTIQWTEVRNKAP